MVDEVRVSPDCPEIPEAADVPEPGFELRKQISLLVALPDYRRVREEAARRRIAMSDLLRRWIEPELNRLRPCGVRKYAGRKRGKSEDTP